MTHSLIFPFFNLNHVSLLFHTPFCRKLSRFCKVARRTKAVGPPCLRIYERLHIRYLCRGTHFDKIDIKPALIEKCLLAAYIVTCKLGLAVGLGFYKLRVHSVIPCHQILY